MPATARRRAAAGSTFPFDRYHPDDQGLDAAARCRIGRAGPVQRRHARMGPGAVDHDGERCVERRPAVRRRTAGAAAGRRLVHARGGRPALVLRQAVHLQPGHGAVGERRHRRRYAFAGRPEPGRRDVATQRRAVAARRPAVRRRPRRVRLLPRVQARHRGGAVPFRRHAGGDGAGGGHRAGADRLLPRSVHDGRRRPVLRGRQRALRARVVARGRAGGAGRGPPRFLQPQQLRRQQCGGQRRRRQRHRRRQERAAGRAGPVARVRQRHELRQGHQWRDHRHRQPAGHRRAARRRRFRLRRRRGSDLRHRAAPRGSGRRRPRHPHLARLQPA